MTKAVDFTKKIVCSDDTIKVVQVIPVNYDNTNFQHLVVYELPDGTQNHCPVNSRGVPMWGSKAYTEQLAFLNPKPKVVCSTYRNVYNSGFVGKEHCSREEADLQRDINRCGILETLKFDDGESKTNFINV